jgi:hypothetical protein
MNERQFAQKVANVAALPLVEIITLIDTVWPLIKKLPCFKKEAEAGIAEAFRAVRKKKGDRIPKPVVKKMKSLGYVTKAQQSLRWDAMCEVAFDHSTEVAEAAKA